MTEKSMSDELKTMQRGRKISLASFPEPKRGLCTSEVQGVHNVPKCVMRDVSYFGGVECGFFAIEKVYIQRPCEE